MDDIVDTSDVDEREEILADDDFAISFASPSMKCRRSDEDLSPRKRKRIKIAHDVTGDVSALNDSHELAVVSPPSHLFINHARPYTIRSPSPSPPRPLSLSTGDYSPFSSPHRCPITPPRTSSQPSSHSEAQNMYLVTSSPLTPPSSPAHLLPTPSQSPDPLLLICPPPQPPHTLAPPPSSPPAIPPPVQSSPLEVPEDPRPLGRYSFRRREARQLNPYAYDKLLYKQQLKSHPDAIVKYRSPPRQGTSGVAEDGTQADYSLFHDNPDEDGDYMQAGNDGRRRRRRSWNEDRRSEDVEGLGARQAKEGWLPEILKALPSSDEDEDDMSELARKVRRERKKAAAFARAEARSVAAKVRPLDKEAKGVTKRRPKPFPVDGDAEHVSRRSHLSPSVLPSRAHSEPAIAARSPSHPTSTFRPLIVSRASSHSPAPSSKPLLSPDFSVCMLQEESHQFADDDVPFPQNITPIDLSEIHSTPPSPSAPATTSDADALPSNVSGIDSDSDPMCEMSAKDKKALKRVMPAVWIRRLAFTKVFPTPRARDAVESSGSEAEEVRLIPGRAVVRKGKYRDVEVKGDPESSVDESSEVPGGDGHDDDGRDAMDLFSDGESSVRVRRTRQASPRAKREDDVISLSDGSTSASSDEGSENGSSDDEQVHESLSNRLVRGPVREKSVINWLFIRPRGPGKTNPGRKHPKSPRKARGSGVSTLNVVTSGARPHGEYHQTRLPFARANTESDVASAKQRRASKQRNWTTRPDRETAQESKKPKKQRKRQPGANQGPVYNVNHDATRITSKYRASKSNRNNNALVINEDDDDLMQALDPGWRAEIDRWNKPLSPARHPAANEKSNTPAPPRPRLYRQSSLPQNEFPLPTRSRHEEEPFASVRRPIFVDMKITPLPSGVKLRTSSYVEKGLLFQLVSVMSGNSEVTPPMYCDMQGLEIGPTTSAAVFSGLLGPLCDRLASALRECKSDDVDTMKEWEFIARAACQLLSWVAVHAEDQEFVALEMALRDYLDGLLLVLESLETTVFLLTAYWFVVELFARLAAGVKYRRGSAENGHFIRSAKQLVRRLLGVDLQPAFATFYAIQVDTEVTSLPHRAVELWVCLIHLLPSFKIFAEASPGHPLWRLLGDLHPASSLTGPKASEAMWHTIFSLCAISQFSVHGLSTSVSRLPAAWELVATVLKKIILTSNPEQSPPLSRHTLKGRDEYLSYIVSRCFLLWSQWGWRLDDGAVMFKSLQEIFRSRNFANLLNEHPAPMDFLEHGDLELLSKRDPHDTVFEIFLKMVVQAVYLLNANGDLDAKQRSAHVKKLLQIAVPVSPVPFSRSAPPSTHSLSMLVNRLSAMVIAVHLDSTSANIKFRVNQARRCVNFKDADDRSRMVCIYGMMNFAMIVRHHKTVGGLEEVLGWLGEMADVLMDEYKEGETDSIGKKSTVTLIQLLIGSVRRVIETQSLDKGQIRAEYPDPALLDGPWITRVFNPRTDLVTIQQTGVEIRMLVQSFLDARVKALPEAQPPPVVHSAESQESQDEYEKVYLDLADEDVWAVLGDVAAASNVAELKSKEDALCKVLDKFITPAVYRLVCKHFGEREHVKDDATSHRAADEWIDCWVGCANVLVQNNYKDWGLYMKLGQQSWEKIIDDSWRRRVGLRFNLTLLRLDPGAYNKMKDDFIAVLLVATLSSKATIEHEFMSVVLTLDGLRHPLLRGAPFDPTPGTRKYEVSAGDYEVARKRLIKTVLANTAGCFRAKVDGESQGYVELVVMMLSTMRKIYESVEDKEEYGAFCGEVVGMLECHGALMTHPRVMGLGLCFLK